MVVLLIACPSPVPPPFLLNYEVRSGTDTLRLSFTASTADTTMSFCPIDSLLAFDTLEVAFGLLADANCQDTLNVRDTLTRILPARDTVAETLCPGGSLLVNGTLYDEGNPTGQDTLLGAAVAGCDSIVFVSLSFFPRDTNFLNRELCFGSSLTVNGTVYDEGNPSGVEVIPGGTANGCDSVVQVSLTFSDVSLFVLEEALCPGGSLLVNGTLYDESNPMGADTIPMGSVTGCDSVIQVMLSFFPTDTALLEGPLCPGDSIVVNGAVYNEANPTGTEILAGAAENGCDSIVVIALQFLPLAEGSLMPELCPGDSIIVNGTVYNESNLSGTEILEGAGANGCDSILTIQLAYLQPDTGRIEGPLCFGSSITVNGTLYDEQNPSGTEVLANAGSNGCDSIVVVDLSFVAFASNEIVEALCPGDSIVVNGTVYNEANPTGVETLPDASQAGCDSVITIQLSFFSVDTFRIEETICGDTALVVNGTTYDMANPSGTEVFENGAASGCDSVVIIHLDFRQPAVNDIAEMLCPGDSLVVNGTVYNPANLMGSDTLSGAAANGCDSIINVAIAYFLIDTTYLNGPLCFGSSVTVNGVVYDEGNPSGTEIFPNGSANGCDSIVVVDLSFANSAQATVSETLCPGDSIVVNGTVYNQTNPTGVETLPDASQAGCDSVITVALSFFPSDTAQFEPELCPGDTLIYNGTAYHAGNLTGTEVFPGATANGCDSVVEVSVQLLSAPVGTISDVICASDSVEVNGTIYSIENPLGTEVFPGAGANGCDSIVQVQLSFFPSDTAQFGPELCPGDTLIYNGTAYHAGNLTGTEVFPGATANGCDSVVEVSVQLLSAPVGTISDVICASDSVEVNGTIYSIENPLGTEVFPGAGANGCDSIVQVQLSFFPSDTAQFEPELCPGDTLIYNGTAYHAGNLTGTEVFPGATANGCDSVVEVSVQLLPEALGQLSPALCPGDSIVVNGTVYDQGNPAGTEVLQGAAANGCDSIVSINLLYFELDTNRIEATLCQGDSLLVNGAVYNAAQPAGLEVIPGASQTGCDSIILVDLTFINAVSTPLTPVLCPSDTLLVNGTAYHLGNPSGTETIEGGAANGCDSIIQVGLQFFPQDTATLAASLCPGESVLVNGTVYDEANPSGFEVLPGATVNGCDSLVRIALDFLPIPVDTLQPTLCQGESLTVGNQVFDEGNPSGTVVLPNAAANGCDSVVVVSLAFTPQVSATLSGPSSLCPGDSAVLTVQLSGGMSYDFVLSSTQGVVETFNSVAGPVTIVVSPGQTTDYFITGLSVPGSNCPADNGAPLAIQVADLAIEVEAVVEYGGWGVSCAGAADGELQANVSGGSAPYVFSWSDGQAGPSASGLMAGAYSVTVTDDGGCVGTDSLVLTEPEPLVVQAAGVDVDCKDPQSGQIQVLDIFGGTDPYLFALGDEGYAALDTTAFTLSRLAAGGYSVRVQDANGCEASVEVAVSPPQELLLELGDDRTIRLGDSLQLLPQATFDVAAFTWQPDTIMLYTPFVSPARTTVYRLTAQDANGCTATDEVMVIVDREREVYAPNAFSPNGDGRNDFFTIFAGPQVREIRTFRIFDRWGDMVFEGGPMQPNIEAFGWDGAQRGEPMNPGVFVFYAEIVFVDGSVELLEGDFVLMR
ncbi:T9SS type B sorting domain-containing protein [Phaeodactylibacter luteus]|nr:gliding motility-associated C-terminal domain-containing protein [Phaeodactylibacter luteus]